MSTASNQTQVNTEEKRIFLEGILIKEYLGWVDATDAYKDEQKKRIHDICARSKVINGQKTDIPDVKAITEGLKDFEEDRHAKFVKIMLDQFSEMTFGDKYMAPSEKSSIHESIVRLNSVFGRYSSMFVPARSRASYAKSRMNGTYNAVLEVLKAKIKPITNGMNTSGIKEMSFFEVLEEITKKVYISVLEVPITKCNVPIIDIFTRMFDNKILNSDDKQANHNAMIVIRFFMMVETIFDQAKKIIEDEDLVDTLEDIQDDCIPFNRSDMVTLEMLGLDENSFQNDNRAIAGAIKFEDRNTFTKIIIESVVLAGYISVVKQEKQGKVFETFLEGLRFIAVSKQSRLSVIHGLGTLAKFFAYYLDFNYVDGICGYFGLHLQEPTLPINYPDLYGMIYSVDEKTKTCYSMAPRVMIDINLSSEIWKAGNIEVFKKLHFDNGYGKVIYGIPKAQEEIDRKDRFIRLAEGYDLCASYITEIPKFVKKTTQFKEILHCVLKATIGYPADFSKRNINKVDNKEVMKTTKRFELEKIVIHKLQTAKTASSISQSHAQPDITQDNYFTLVSPANGQFRYAHISKP